MIKKRKKPLYENKTSDGSFFSSKNYKGTYLRSGETKKGPRYIKVSQSKIVRNPTFLQRLSKQSPKSYKRRKRR